MLESGQGKWKIGVCSLCPNQTFKLSLSTFNSGRQHLMYR